MRRRPWGAPFSPQKSINYLRRSSLQCFPQVNGVARVNRLFEDEGSEKEFGFIIDYEGLRTRKELEAFCCCCR